MCAQQSLGKSVLLGAWSHSKWVLGRLTTISHMPYHCSADNCKRAWSRCILTDVTYQESQVQSDQIHAFIHSHPLSQVSSSNHHHHNRTSALGGSGLFGSTICQNCSTHGNWAPDKSLKAYYSVKCPLCVFAKPSPVTAPNVHLCVCRVGGGKKMQQCEPVQKRCLIKLSLRLLQQGPHPSLSISLLG